MHEREQAIFANMVMICDGSRVLVQDRKKAGWTGIAYPGGHVEPGESFVRAAKREVKEETGLDVHSLRLCGVKQWTDPEEGYRYVVFLYRTDDFSGTLRSSDEGEVFWLERAELFDRETASGFREMVEIFEREDVSEDYYRYDGADWRQENL